MLPRPLLILAMTGLFPVAAPGQEWTRFRGPDGQGIASSPLPEELGPAQVRFRVKAGSGHSSPVLWGEKLFLTRTHPDGRHREIVCYDAGAGRELWVRKRPLETLGQHRLNDFASTTPTVDASTVYVVWAQGEGLEALALDHAGKLRWARRFGSFRAQHGHGTSPVLAGGTLIIANDNAGPESFLMALDPETGKTRWQLERRSKSRSTAYSTPVPYRVQEGPELLLFSSTAHGLTAVDPKTGRQHWEWNPSFRSRCVNTPCLVAGLVFYSTGSGGGGKEAAVLRLGAKRPEVAFELRRALPYVPSAIALDGRLYLFSDGGILSCYDTSGALVGRQRLEGSFFSSPVSDGKTIYIADRAGVLYSIAPGAKFAVRGSMELGSAVQATPAIAGGRLYVRTAQDLVCLGAAAGEAGKRGKQGE